MEELTLAIRGVPKLGIFSLIPIFLSGYYIFVTDASSRSKSIIVLLLVLSFVVLFVVPGYWLLVLLLQAAIGIYIIFYLAWTRK
jgi:hypothetical protein